MAKETSVLLGLVVRLSDDCKNEQGIELGC